MVFSTVSTAHAIEGMGPNENQICTVRKHFIGIIVLYIQAGIGLLAAFGLMAFLLPEFIPEETRTRYDTVIALVLVLISAIIFLLLLLATYIYRQNLLIVSDRNVTQILQRGLFHRQVSELSLANVEDVTAEQRGILASIFNFGDLRIETAGEQHNFHFTYCPRPNYFGKVILDARQRYIDSDPDRVERANDHLNVPRGMASIPPPTTPTESV